MKFKEGDRVRIKDTGKTGTIYLVTYDANPNIGAAKISLDDSGMFYYCFTIYLEHLKISRPEPDWKDIWESNSV